MTGIIKVEKGQAALLPVMLIDDSDFKTPETGVAFGSVTCDYAKEGDSSLTNYALSGQWDEIGRGIYDINFTGSELDTLGLFKYVVYGSGYLQYPGCVMVVDHNPESDIKAIKDSLTAIEPEVSVHIDHPEEIKIPDGSNTLNGALAAGATSVIFDDASSFPDKGYFKCESEWIYYGAKSVNTLSSLVRAQFGTGDATHADGTAVYQGIPHKTILTIHDAGVPLAPNSTPQITIKTIGGTTIQSATNMTQEGAKDGIYYFDILFASDQNYPDVWVLMYDVEALSGKTNEYRMMSLIVGESATPSDLLVSGNTPLAGLRQATQDGYYDGSGTFTAWTDDEVGVWTDAQGDFVFRGLIVWQHIVSSAVKRQVNPPASTYSEADGEWVVFIAPGTYMVHFWKDGLKDIEVERTVT